eukprot:EG_transcript_16466
MANITQAVEKLSSLLQLGVITPEEFEQRRQKLVDQFVGGPTLGGAPVIRAQRPPMRGAAGPRRGAYGAAAPYMQLARVPGVAGPVVLMPRGPYVRGGAPRFAPYSSKPKGPSNSIKISPVPDFATPEELKAIFAPYGAISAAIVKHNQPYHGYVNFTTHQEAATAVAAGDVELHGQVCNVIISTRPHQVVTEGAPTNGIGIFNIPFTMTQEEVISMLTGYPGFQSLKYITTKLGQFRGYVFAYFDSVDNATIAKSQLLGLPIGDQVLDVKYANKAQDLF